MRNSRHPDGPALVYTRAEIEAFINGAKDGDFDDLIRALPRNDDDLIGSVPPND